MHGTQRLTGHPILTFDRKHAIRFTFNGRVVNAFEGETIAGALYADGVRIFSRSFRYHRPRGLLCMSGHCGQCMMRVDGQPNVRTCVTRAENGMQVESQNAWPSLKFDVAGVTNYLGFLVRPGFQYRRFIRQRRLYHVWERFLRKMAGIGELSTASPSGPVRRREASAEIVVVGAGVAGMAVACHAARAGAPVWLFEKEDSIGGCLRYETAEMRMPWRPEIRRGFAWVSQLADRVRNSQNCRVFTSSTVFAWYDEDVLAAVQPGVLWVLHPRCVVVATGSYENPLIFENNDLPGIFLGRGLQRLMHRDGVSPGQQAVVITGSSDGYLLARQLLEAGIKVRAVADQRPEGQGPDLADRFLQESAVSVYHGYEVKAAVGRRRVKAVLLQPIESLARDCDGKQIKVACDILCISGYRCPANDLVFQRTCRGEYVLQSSYHYVRQPVLTTALEVASGLYVAGEANGCCRPDRAYLEGKIAGLAAARQIGFGGQAEEHELDEARSALRLLSE